MSTAIKQSNCESKNDKGKDCMKCELKHPIPKKILFECSPSSAVKTFASQGQSFTAACVAIDTTCICKPKVKIEFSSMITLNADVTDDFEVGLRFELIKVCDNRKELSCGTWMYERIISRNISDFFTTLTDSFSFIYCECQSCPGCCQYFVRVTADTFLVGGQNVTVTVAGSNMAAIAI